MMLEATSTDHTAAGLTDLLDQMTRATLDVDHVAAAILASARQFMRALARDRYAARKTCESRHRQFIGYHRAPMAQRAGL
jgi:hypothetical protein